MTDYYQILGVEPSATITEIKKAYRKLAHQFHPDKNASDPYAAAHFAEIKQAYEVLTNPAKKQYYLEQRWFEQSQGRKKAQPIVTPEAILKQAIEFDRHVSRLDVHRMNKLGLFQYIRNELLPDEVIEKLNGFGDKAINKDIISFLLKNLHVIPSNQLASMEQILLNIHAEDGFKLIIMQAIERVSKEYQLEKNKIWILFLLAIGIVLVIVLLGN